MDPRLVTELLVRAEEAYTIQMAQPVCIYHLSPQITMFNEDLIIK